MGALHCEKKKVFFAYGPTVSSVPKLSDLPSQKSITMYTGWILQYTNEKKYAIGYLFLEIFISISFFMSIYLGPHGFASSAGVVYMCNWLICQG